MLTRRWVLQCAAASALVFDSQKAEAIRQCTGNSCIAGVDLEEFYEEAYDEQEKSQWCWAASISMIFSYYQHPVEQRRIVRTVYGSTSNLPAMSGATIAAQLNRSWTDDNGQKFKSRLRAAFDADVGVFAIDARTMVRALRRDQPMIVGTRSHAMVLTSVQYVGSEESPNIIRAGVFDPYPGRGSRSLQQDELVPIFQGGSLRFIGLPIVMDA